MTAYVDQAEGWMTEEPSGAGQFTRVVLRPRVTVAPGTDVAEALALHEPAAAKCFIARLVNFAVAHEPEIVLAG